MPTHDAVVSHEISRRFSAWILLCFFLSGATGLIYEILWTRMLVQVIGGAPFAVSTILTVFMLGLGLGSYLASRRIDEVTDSRRLLWAYGVLELVIAGYCLLIPALLALFRPAFALLYQQLYDQFLVYSLLTFLGCAVLLFTPAVCMGVTLPLLCRFYVTRWVHLGTKAGRLYGLNTIGAALGALLCGFWLISSLGVRGTLYLAVAVNLLIGVSCVLLGRRAPGGVLPRSGSGTEAGSRTEAGSGTEASPADVGGAASVGGTEVTAGQVTAGQVTGGQVTGGALSIMLLFGVSGFCSMAYEVIWTKLLALIVGPTTYSFTMVLVTFISCLAIGSLVFGWAADRVSRPLSLLVVTQVVAGLAALVVSQVLGTSQFFFAKLIYHFQDDFLILTSLKGGVLFLLMLLPTVCLGAAFPLVSKICTPALGRMGRSIGLAYAINTVGAVLGSFCAGFILIPFLGKELSLRWVCGLQLVVPLLFVGRLLRDRRLSGDRKVPWGIVVTSFAAVAGLVGVFFYPSWDRHSLATGKYHRFDDLEPEFETASWSDAFFRGPQILARYHTGSLVHYGDGIGGFTTVIEFPTAFGDAEFAMANSGKPDASSRGDMETQTLLAHAPLLFARDAKSVLVIGLASGITAGEVLHYPIEQLDVVEISRKVIEASRYFVAWNHDVLEDPRTRVFVQDARAHVLLTDTKYDVVISEPSNPWMAGLAALFTTEFFASVKERLNDGGVFCQWLHAYQMDWPTFALVGRTFAAVFEDSLLLVSRPSTEGKDFLLLGFRGDAGLSLENAAKNLQYLEQSKNITLSDPRLLYRLLVSEDLRQLFADGPTNTDEWPRLEFEAPKLMYHEGREVQDLLKARRRLHPQSRAMAVDVARDVDLQIEYASFALSVHEPFRDMVDLARAGPKQKERYFELWEKYSAGNIIRYAELDDELARRCTDVQIASLERIVQSTDAPAISSAYLGSLRQKKGDFDGAIADFKRSLQLAENAEVHSKLGSALLRRGQGDEAIAHYQRALSLRPFRTKTLADLGRAWLQQGQAEKGVASLREALRWNPELADAHSNLGSAYAQQKRYREAIPHFQEALRLKPELWRTRKNLELAEKRLVEEEGSE